MLGYNFILSNSDVKGKNPNDDFFDELYEQFNVKRVLATRMVNANSENYKLGVILSCHAFRFNFFVHSSQIGFSLQSQTQFAA